jgi:hypothetical protein
MAVSIVAIGLVGSIGKRAVGHDETRDVGLLRETPFAESHIRAALDLVAPLVSSITQVEV